METMPYLAAPTSLDVQFERDMQYIFGQEGMIRIDRLSGRYQIA